MCREAPKEAPWLFGAECGRLAVDRLLVGVSCTPRAGIGMGCAGSSPSAGPSAEDADQSKPEEDNSDFIIEDDPELSAMLLSLKDEDGGPSTVLLRAAELGAPSQTSMDDRVVAILTRQGAEQPRAFLSSAGAPKANQDCGVVCWPFNNSRDEALLCIFDGHGEHGERVAGWASDEVAGRLEARRTQLHTDPLRCLSETVVAMDQALLGHPELGGIAHTAGTTTSMPYLRGDSLHVACTGDSRAVMGRVNGGKIVAVDLSTDHRPDLPDEKARALTLKLNRTRNANRPPPTPAGREGTGPDLDLNLDLNPCPATDRAGGRLRLGG